METYESFTSTFYKSLFKDIRSIFPQCSDDLNTSLGWLIKEIDRDKAATLRSLTRLGKNLEQACISLRGLVVPTLDTRFTCVEHTRLPRFCYSLFRCLFDDGGNLLPQEERINDDAAFVCLRQILLAFSKVTDIEPDASPEDQIIDFVMRMKRRQLPFETGWSNPEADEFRSIVIPIARSLLRRLFYDEEGRFHPFLAQWREMPWGRHGSGAVEDGSKGSQKWRLTVCERIQSDLVRDAFGPLSTVTLNTGDGKPWISRLAQVPKDLRKRRLICIEPKEMMFAQQGLMKVLYDVINSHHLTKRAIHLFDQSHNFYAARRKGMSTIDLSDASDLLSIRLCKLLLPKEVFGILTRYRSDGIMLPDGDIIKPYYAMATMGNALCFPVESLIFWALTLSTMISEDLRYGVYRSPSEVAWVLNNNPGPLIRRYPLYVFGDDIIVPEIVHNVVRRMLGWAGLSANVEKCCTGATPIRESCGAYWWNGSDARVVRFKYSEYTNALGIVSLMDQVQSLESMGFNSSAQTLREVIRPFVPVSKEPSQVRLEVKGGRMRYKSVTIRGDATAYQRLEARVPRLCDGQPSKLPGDVSLYAYFTCAATRPASFGYPQRVKWEWVPVDKLTHI